ncbi:MFS transporter [Pseudobutyrivibrio sp. MD2005]|uniref:MFS transporter n=1 Tax=Pseudobutyrivibrio sp. MD2005 TaxID=1410616 RepID=UPI0004825001|nr:MFS transporter [Pseudobutyrivibrio sp. MD2005]
MKNYFFSHKIKTADVILLVVIGLLLTSCLYIRLPISEALSKTREISLGYITREYNGLYYVIDNGHARIMCFDSDGKERFSITDPSDDGNSILYIDDCLITDENLYLSVSEWDGMLLARELIMKYDLDGNYIENVTENIYGGYDKNKHSFYGLAEKQGELMYGECKTGSVVIHHIKDGNDEEYIIPYTDAYDAVSDLVIDGDTVIIMDKNGQINRYDNTIHTLLYTTEWENEDYRIPYCMDVKNGNVYFTDIRSCEAVKVDSENKKTDVMIEGIDSQTVTVCSDNDDLLVTNSDGVKRFGENEAYFTEIEKSDSDLTKQYIFLGCAALLLLIGILFLFRLFIVITHFKFDSTKSASFTIVIVGAVVLIIISTTLLNAFRDTYMEKIREQLKATALIVSESIDETDMSNIEKASDFNSESYHTLINKMERAFPLNLDFYKTAYCNILKLSDDEQSGYGIAYLDQSIGVYFPLDEVEYSEVKEVYDTGNEVWNDAVADVTGTYLSVKIPIYSSDSKVIGAVAVGADTYVVSDMIQQMQRDVLFSIVIIMLLLWVMTSEGISFFVLLNRFNEKKTAGVVATAVPIHLIRLLIFLVFTAFNMVSSFLPVYILKRCELFAGSNAGLIASLPLTINIFIMGIMSLVSANLVRRFGIKKIFMFACLFSMIGNLAMLIPNYFTMILGLLFDGIGVGLISNSIYIMLTYLDDKQVRDDCLNNYNSASLSGINMGMIIGGLLATTLTQRYVFIFVAVTWLSLFFFAGFLAGKLEDVITTDGEEELIEDSRQNARGFILNKTILSFFALIQNPYIIFNSFVFYLVPIFAESIGYNETVISVLLVLYSEVAVLLGTSMISKTEKTCGDYAIYLAIGFNVVAVALFVTMPNLTGIIISLIIMGISASFGKPIHQSFFLKQKPTMEFGQDKAMGIYNFTENIGESLGPIVFSRLLGVGVVTNIGFLACISGLGLLHFIMNGKELNHGK